MNRKDWALFAWIWMAGMTGIGIGLLVVTEVFPLESSWTRDGLGTALQLVAASILFVVVIEALTKVDKNAIVVVASSLTAIFGYVGTIFILERENPLLMAVILLFTFYLFWTGIAVVWIIKGCRAIIDVIYRCLRAVLLSFR